jgi:hypothetical protein
VPGIGNGRDLWPRKCHPPVIQFIPGIQQIFKISRSWANAHARTRCGVLVPVKWRDELFLVPQDRIKDFSDYVAGLGDFNALLGLNLGDLEESYFYSRYAGKNVVSVGTPVLPREYEHL